MVPTAFAVLPELPLTPSGKVNRRALSPPARRARPPVAADAAPRGEHEQRLAVVWQTVLKVDQVARTDSFFDLGGHSLLALRALALYREQHGVEIPLRTLFEHPTIGDLAACLESPQAEPSVPLPPVTVGDADGGCLSFAQQRLWFIDRLEGSVHYHMTRAWSLADAVDPDAIAAALAAVAARHTPLQSVITATDDSAAQQLGAGAVTLERSATDDIDGVIDAFSRRPFDLSREALRGNRRC
jgi:acyl carrier protein